MNNGMLNLADELKDLRLKKAELEANLKEINALVTETEEKLSEVMLNNETQSFNKNGTLFYLSNKVYASAKADKKPELYKQLKNNGFGSLVTETVNANSLAAFVKEQMEENNDELPNWLEDNINVFEKSTVRVRKTKI